MKFNSAFKGLNNLPLRVLFRQETVKTRMEQCEGSFVADAPVECGGQQTSAAQVLPSAVVCCYLKTQQIITSWPIRKTASRKRLNALNKIFGRTEFVTLV